MKKKGLRALLVEQRKAISVLEEDKRALTRKIRDARMLLEGV